MVQELEKLKDEVNKLREEMEELRKYYETHYHNSNGEYTGLPLNSEEPIILDCSIVKKIS